MNKLREARIKRRWSQAKLAKEAGVGYAGLSRYEQGWSTPTRQTAKRLADALGVTVTQIYPNQALKNRGGA